MIHPELITMINHDYYHSTMLREIVSRGQARSNMLLSIIDPNNEIFKDFPFSFRCPGCNTQYELNHRGFYTDNYEIKYFMCDKCFVRTMAHYLQVRREAIPNLLEECNIHHAYKIADTLRGPITITCQRSYIESYDVNTALYEQEDGRVERRPLVYYRAEHWGRIAYHDYRLTRSDAIVSAIEAEFNIEDYNRAYGLGSTMRD